MTRWSPGRGAVALSSRPRPSIRVPVAFSHAPREVCVTAARGRARISSRTVRTAIPAGVRSTASRSAASRPGAFWRKVPSSAPSSVAQRLVAVIWFSAVWSRGPPSTAATSTRSRWAASIACNMAR